MSKATFEEIIQRDGKLIYTNKGNSMMPLIKEGRDLLVIERTNGRLKRFDVPLYKRDTGQYVLHRIMRVRKNDYVGRSEDFHTRRLRLAELRRKVLPCLDNPGSRLASLREHAPVIAVEKRRYCKRHSRLDGDGIEATFLLERRRGKLRRVGIEPVHGRDSVYNQGDRGCAAARGNNGLFHIPVEQLCRKAQY